MSYPSKGRADHLELGDWNVVCFECGCKRKASGMKKHWQGYYVCPEHWEPRHPQDFVRATQDIQTPPWTQPKPAEVAAVFCTPAGLTAIADYATPDCATPDYIFPSFNPATGLTE
jgi:hypothetical protein